MPLSTRTTAPAPLLDGVAPIHEHRVSTRELLMLLSAPSMILVIAVAVPVVYASDLLWRGFFVAHLQRNQWEIGSFLVAPLLVAALLGWLVRSWRRRLDLQIYVYPSAISFWQAGRARSIHFNDIIEVADGTYLGSNSRFRAYQDYLLTLEGEVLSIAERGRNGLRAPIELAALQEHFARAYGVHAGARQLEIIRAGGRVAYGRACWVDAAAIGLQGRRIAWQNVRGMSRTTGRRDATMTLTPNDGAPITVPQAELVDYPALAFVASHLMRRPAQGAK